MAKVDIVRIPARLNHLGVDELYYELETDDWHDRAMRLQNRRWHHIRTAMQNLRHVQQSKERV